jgi:hypothetical protein
MLLNTVKFYAKIWMVRGPAAMRSVHARGKVSWKEPSWVTAATAAMEQQTTYSNYHEFQVTHRILPDTLTKESSPSQD